MNRTKHRGRFLFMPEDKRQTISRMPVLAVSEGQLVLISRIRQGF
jgi:hypothetical protein